MPLNMPSAYSTKDKVLAKFLMSPLDIEGSTAPGGSVTGQPGRNAAIVILQDDGKSLDQVFGKPLRGP